MEHKVTIREVADYANVAVSTVSRVINGRDRVSPETRERVKQAIHDLGFVKNNLAASIKTGSTGFIVTVVPDIINEFYSAVIRGVEDVASKLGYYVLVYATSELRSKELAVFGGEFSHLVDGVILVPSTANASIYRSIDKPTVIIDRDIPGSGMYSVVVDNYQGSRLVLDELIQYGHSKIAIITGPSVFNVGIDRMNAYVDALVQNHIPIRDEYICTGSWYQEDGYRFANQLLDQSDPPTAIFAANNLLCTGAAECLCDRGLDIGKDISLVGFDDSIALRYIGGGITGISRATDEMGRIGARMLISLLSGHPECIEQRKVVLECKIIRRHSVARV